MPVTVKVNGVANSLVHKGSNGISIATIPDVCKTPSPGGPVPIPYPNISQSATLDKGTTTVKADGGMMIATKGSEFSLSNGDNAGVAGGVKSSTFMKESTWILYSFDVKMDGKNACRLTDKKFQNHENTVDLAGNLQSPTVPMPPGCDVATSAATAANERLPEHVKEDSYVVAGAKYEAAPNEMIAPVAMGVSGGALRPSQIVIGGKYSGFSKGIKRGQPSNVKCPSHPNGFGYSKQGRPKEGHAESRILEDMFKQTAPAAPAGTLYLKVVGEPICPDCRALIDCAKAAGLKVVECP